MNTKIDTMHALYRKVRAAMIKELQAEGIKDTKISVYLSLSTQTIASFIECVNKRGMPKLDAPKYMFADKPVLPDAWRDIQIMALDCYQLGDGTALLVNHLTREYCYVYWDEAQQGSNPYPSHDEAKRALRDYASQL